jgi:hypothetical protein
MMHRRPPSMQRAPAGRCSFIDLALRPSAGVLRRRRPARARAQAPASPSGEAGQRAELRQLRPLHGRGRGRQQLAVSGVRRTRIHASTARPPACLLLGARAAARAGPGRRQPAGPAGRPVGSVQLRPHPNQRASPQAAAPPRPASPPARQLEPAASRRSCCAAAAHGAPRPSPRLSRRRRQRRRPGRGGGGAAGRLHDARQRRGRLL